MKRAVFASLVVALTIAAPGASPLGAPLRPSPDRALRQAMLAAEDRRVTTREAAAPLLKGLGDPDPEIQRVAVRAIGRLENPGFAPDVLPVLSAASPRVRAEAANALGQLAMQQPALAMGAIVDRLRVEKDAGVLGVLCETLGRLPYADVPDMERVEALLVAEARPDGVHAAERAGAAAGLEALIRQGWRSQFRPTAATTGMLASFVTRRDGPASSVQVRRLALMALAASRAVNETQEQALRDPDAQVRRLAVAAAGIDVPFDRRPAIVARGLTDGSPMVRYEALRVHGRLLASASCDPEMAALDDASPQVRLLAIDLLATACPGSARATAALAARARLRPRAPAPGAASGPWHVPAHALVALARRVPDDARPLVASFARDPQWEVRMYSARAAQATGDAATLDILARDGDANVQEAALSGLASVRGHAADRTFIDALGRPGYQVVLEAARALTGTPLRDETGPALLAALARITGEQRDTSRDPRLALLDRLLEVGGPPQAAALRPYLSDFDPVIAARAADILTTWTGTPVHPVTTRLAAPPEPTLEEIAELPAGLRITMADGGSFDLRFLTAEAPLSAWRIMRLVEADYYRGLTFHRVVPNFVIQGGSPGANEFVGDGAFMRDELGLVSNARGTVGVSTRGRDTGDAQFYVNMVDNPRLDHQYTVFAEITRGLDVVDGILEGAVMARVEPLRGRR